MLAKLFKKNGAGRIEAGHPTLARLSKLGLNSALCTRVRTADGREVRDEVGPVSFFHHRNRLFTRGGALFLAPPDGFDPDEHPFAGRGEVLNFRFYHAQTPYSLDCQVLQRVRFSDRLLVGGLEPGVSVGYKLTPVGRVIKNENRRSLRFAHIRGAPGPQVFPNFRFDLFVERVRTAGPAHDRLPEVVPFPGDEPVPEEVLACGSPEEMVALFHRTLMLNPTSLQQVHATKALQEARSGAVQMLDLGYTPVLGLRGEQRGLHIHLRCPRSASPKDRHAPGRLREGDVVILRYVGRGPVGGQDVHYRLICRVSRCGIETLVVRPKGKIEKQTGLPVLVRDFSVSGVGIQNSPLLETYLLSDVEIPENPAGIIERLEGTVLLLHFYPRLHFPKDLAPYRPRVPAAFSLLGEIVRGRVDTGKDDGRINDLGVAFRYDPANYGRKDFEVTAWEPLRGLRDNAHFKEIHRALNAMLAYLER